MAFATIEDVKLEGNLSDELVEEHRDLIEYRMQQIESRIRRLRPWLPDDDYNAKMAVIYGTLAYLQHHGYLAAPISRQLGDAEEIKEGDITIKYSKAEAERKTETAEFDYLKLFRKYLFRVVGMRAFTAGTTFRLRNGSKRRIGFDWDEFWSGRNK